MGWGPDPSKKPFDLFILARGQRGLFQEPCARSRRVCRAFELGHGLEEGLSSVLNSASATASDPDLTWFEVMLSAPCPDCQQRSPAVVPVQPLRDRPARLAEGTLRSTAFPAGLRCCFQGQRVPMTWFCLVSL